MRDNGQLVKLNKDHKYLTRRNLRGVTALGTGCSVLVERLVPSRRFSL